MMREPFSMTTQIDAWFVSFGMKGKKPFIKAYNSYNNRILVAPDDNDQIADLIPFEEWPAFAHSLIHHQPSDSQERLI